MRRLAFALSGLVFGLTLGGRALAVQPYYEEVIQDLGATGCPTSSSTSQTVQGCMNLCHVQDPNGAGANALPPGTSKLFCQTLVNQFGWTTAEAQSETPSTLDKPLQGFDTDPSYAAALAVIKNGCGDPTAAIEDAGVSAGSGVVQPEYGCSVVTGSSNAASGIAVGVAAALFGASLFVARRRRRG